MGHDTLRHGEYEFCDRCHKMYFIHITRVSRKTKKIPVSIKIYNERLRDGQIRI